jgi:Na+-transporting methylmalonyl-CoA/oxaloacetate decarboxylase gamma subunit
MPEWLTFSLNFSLIGLLIVFSVLALIALFVFTIRRVDDRWQEREQAQREAALAKEQNIDSITLVLIAAAVATVVQGRFHIRRVRRLLPRDAFSGPWSVHGRAILHGSHVISKRNGGSR